MKDNLRICCFHSFEIKVHEREKIILILIMHELSMRIRKQKGQMEVSIPRSPGIAKCVTTPPTCFADLGLGVILKYILIDLIE